MASSPTEKTLKYYRDQGYDCAVVEYFNTFVNKRYDLFGFADVLAVGNGEVLFIQCTSTSNMSAREKKISENEVAQHIKTIPNCRIIVMGWKKYKTPKDGKWWRPTIREQ